MNTTFVSILDNLCKQAGTSQAARSSGAGNERNENQPPNQPPARPPPPGEQRNNFRRRLRNLERDLAAAEELVSELEEVQRQERQLDKIQRD